MPCRIAVLTPVTEINGVLGRLKEIGEVIYLPDANYKVADEITKKVDAVFVNPNSMGYPLDEHLLSTSSLKYVATASTGTNHIDMSTAQRRGIRVLSLTKEYQTIEKISSTAELAFGLTLSLIRKIPQAYINAQCAWNYQPYVGRQLSELTVGVIGYGRLGKMYYRYAKAFTDNVMYYDPYVEGGVELDELQKKCNVISLHVHLSPETKHMVNAEFIAKCDKPYLINTSRGEIVDEKAVYEALEQGTLAGYAADVLTHELEGQGMYSYFSPNSSQDLLRLEQTCDNVIITPHIGGMTKEAQEIAYNAAVTLLERAIRS